MNNNIEIVTFYNQNGDILELIKCFHYNTHSLISAESQISLMGAMISPIKLLCLAKSLNSLLE